MMIACGLKHVEIFSGTIQYCINI